MFRFNGSEPVFRTQQGDFPGALGLAESQDKARTCLAESNRNRDQTARAVPFPRGVSITGFGSTESAAPSGCTAQLRSRELLVTKNVPGGRKCAVSLPAPDSFLAEGTSPPYLLGEDNLVIDKAAASLLATPRTPRVGEEEEKFILAKSINYLSLHHSRLHPQQFSAVVTCLVWALSRANSSIL